MIPNMPALSVRIDIGKVEMEHRGLNYGPACWKVFWAVVEPEMVVGMTLYEGDSAATLAHKENVYCLGLQINNKGRLQSVRDALLKSDAFRWIAATPMFVDDENAWHEPLPLCGNVAAGGVLVGEAHHHTRAGLKAARPMWQPASPSTNTVGGAPPGDLPTSAPTLCACFDIAKVEDAFPDLRHDFACWLAVWSSFEPNAARGSNLFEGPLNRNTYCIAIRNADGVLIEGARIAMSRNKQFTSIAGVPMFLDVLPDIIGKPFVRVADIDGAGNLLDGAMNATPAFTIQNKRSIEAGEEWIARNSRAIAFLDSCADWTFEAFLEVNRIVGAENDESELRQQWAHSVFILPTAEHPGGVDYLRHLMRQSLVKADEVASRVVAEFQQLQDESYAKGLIPRNETRHSRRGWKQRLMSVLHLDGRRFGVERRSASGARASLQHNPRGGQHWAQDLATDRENLDPVRRMQTQSAARQILREFMSAERPSPSFRALAETETEERIQGERLNRLVALGADAIPSMEHIVFGSVSAQPFREEKAAAKVCEAIGRIGGDEAFSALQRIFALQTNSWEYHRDIKPGVIRGLAYMAAVNAVARRMVGDFVRKEGGGIEVNSILRSVGVDAVVTYDVLGEQFVQDYNAGRASLSDFVRLLASEGDATRARALYHASNRLERQGDKDLALRGYLAALEIDPTGLWVGAARAAQTLLELPREHQLHTVLEALCEDSSRKAVPKERARELVQHIMAYIPVAVETGKPDSAGAQAFTEMPGAGVFPRPDATEHREAKTYLEQGYAHRQEKDYDRAIEWYTKAIEIDPRYVIAYNFRGFAHVRLRQHDAGIADYTRAIELEPRYVNAFNNRGTAYAEKGEFDRAIADFTTAIALAPDRADSYSGRGAAYNELRRYQAAIIDLTKAIELDPTSAIAYSNRGSAYGDSRKFELALSDYSKAIELNPRLANAYSGRASVCITLAKYEQAVADCTAAISLEPGFASAYNNRGVAYYHLGNRQAAITDLKKALERDPSLQKARHSLGEMGVKV